MTWEFYLNAGLSFLAFGLIFWPLESLIPIAQRPLWRRHLGIDLCFLFGNFLIWTPLITIGLVFTLRQLTDHLPLTGLQSAFATIPWWAQIIGALLVSDCCIYWFHRLSHSWSFLWRFHQTHHTAEEVDWIAAYREHPVDNFLTRFIENMPLVLLGLPLHWIAGLAVFRGLWALYIHSNIALDPGPLRYALGSPRLHHWHHELHLGGRSNFANLNPLMDLLFGTYQYPRAYPIKTGTGGGGDKQGYLGLLLRPFRLWQ